MVNVMTAPSIAPAHAPLAIGRQGLLELKPSLLRPPCPAPDQIFQWIGVNTPPLSTIDDPLIRCLEAAASRASLCDTGSYGSGIQKFHVFCDIFSILESDRLPASFPLLHSFVLWAATDPEFLDSHLSKGTQFEPISDAVARKYLAAVRAWHIAQGWAPPLLDSDHERISWSLRGIANTQGSRKHPIRPPVTLLMLRALRSRLILTRSFDACIWAMALCAFWGLMRFGEVSVTSRAAFSPKKHLTRNDVFSSRDANGQPYTRLDLPSAKTAKPGEIQSIFLVEQGDLCPLDVLRNLAQVVPAGAANPLFSWIDSKGVIRPMTKSAAMHHINGVLEPFGWGTSFGHSFRIGGASYFLALGVEAEIIWIHGRWRSLAYEVYICAFELVASPHLRKGQSGAAVTDGLGSASE